MRGLVLVSLLLFASAADAQIFPRRVLAVTPTTVSVPTVTYTQVPATAVHTQAGLFGRRVRTTYIIAAVPPPPAAAVPYKK